MIAFIIRRLLYMIPVLAGILVITLFLFFVVAEDPVLQYAGQNPTEAQLRALRQKYDLDAPAFFSIGWLHGEDIIESKRRERLDNLFERIARDITQGVYTDDAERAFFRRHDLTDVDILGHSWPPAFPAELEATYTAILDRKAEQTAALVQAFDDFRQDWRRGVDLEGHPDEINQGLRELFGDEAPLVSFERIALTRREQAKVNSRRWYDSQFFRVARLDFSDSMQYEEPIWDLIIRKAPITLSITIPMFLIGLAIELSLSLFAASQRGRATDTIITILAVLAMSVPFLSYIILGQWLAAETELVPVSGWAPGFGGAKYLVFPVVIGVIAALGSAVRFYRAVLLEEMDQDYVRTARAKGVRRMDVLFIHVLRNAGIPIVTRLSLIIPFLITGSLLIERMFEIPGLGDLMLSGITARDFWVIMPLTYLLAVVYSVAVLITDIVYAFIDPRVRIG